MRNVILFAFLVFAYGVGAEQVVTAEKLKAYNLDAEFQVLYPSVRITNPTGSHAFYDGVGVRGNINVPIYRSALDLYASVGGKYLDLQNVANDDSQYETSNVLGLGAGLTMRYRALMFGAKHMQVWARHYSSGSFAGRTNYNFGGLEYFGGFYWRFDRLGVGLTYSNQNARISREDTGLTVDSPYREHLFGVQFTFDMGDSLFGLLGRLF